MSVSPGTRLGLYEVTRLIGAGGMGEVYLARDTKLGRDVAIKVLPEVFAQDAERLARFEREAKLLAALNHPNIAGIHGLEQAAGHHYLVLEYVGGEDLSERLRQGPLPVDEALDVAKHVAAAMQAAHEQGIVHRDLKPGNIKFTADGKVKVLDFGLAKDYGGDASASDLSMSPTITRSPSVTGVILGTAAYMSPEQARGRAVDKKSDIWAFGAVLFEMLTGVSAFGGDTISDTVASVLKVDPAWNLLPANTPKGVERLLRRCLQKDAARRLHDIADARIEIEEAAERAPGPESVARQEAVDARRPSRGLAIAWIVAGVLAAAFAYSVYLNLRPHPGSSSRVMHLAIPRPAIENLFGALTVKISPNGRDVVYPVVEGGAMRLYKRPLDDNRETALPEFDVQPFTVPVFSADGNWLLFESSDEKLKKGSLEGGAAVTICESPNGRGVAWYDDKVVLAPNPGGGLYQVSIDGGELVPLTVPDSAKGEVSHRIPHFLPGGKTVLFTIKKGTLESFDDATIAAVSMDTRKIKILFEGGMDARYVPTGHLVYGRDNKLLAVAFDPKKLEVRGAPVTVVDGVVTDPRSGLVAYSFSRNGTLVYVDGPEATNETHLMRVDRNGTAEYLLDERRMFFQPSLSPDGRRVATPISAANDHIWMVDVERKNLSRLTFGPGNDWFPVWSPDGSRIAFSSDRNGAPDLFVVSSEGGKAEPIHSSEFPCGTTTWSPDGGTILFTEVNPESGMDIWALSMEGEKAATPFRQSPGNEGRARFSPNGRWVAYVSDESGRREIYVEPFPGPGPRVQISRSGGVEAEWSPDGTELFYKEGSVVMSVPVSAGGVFRAGTPRRLFDGEELYDLSVFPDGDHFLMAEKFELEKPITHINVVLNWFDELKRLATND